MAIEGYRFAVQEKSASRNFAHGSRDLGIAVGAVIVIPREQRDFVAFLVSQDAVAVVFFFVNPTGLVERLVDQGRKHGPDTKWNAICQRTAHINVIRSAGPESDPAATPYARDRSRTECRCQ